MKRNLIFSLALLLAAPLFAQTPEDLDRDRSKYATYSFSKDDHVYTKDVGTLFTAKARLNRSMPFGTYTFRWSAISPGARVRHWFCFSDGIELKADIRPASAKVGFDFNASSSGVSTKPSLSAYTDVDFAQPVELTYKFDPSGAEHCHVTYLVNGVEAGSFDTSAEVLHTVKWGSSINMYVGCDEEGEGSSAVCEWYEYTAPMNWDE